MVCATTPTRVESDISDQQSKWKQEKEITRVYPESEEN
jgi:hypothetical protein